MNTAVLLLADPSPTLRFLVLTELLDRDSNDPEVRELQKLRRNDPLVGDVINNQESDGSWRAGSFRGSPSAEKLLVTSLALTRLGYLGFDSTDSCVQKGIAYLLKQQRRDGSWPLPAGRTEDEPGEGYSLMPLQTAFPLRALVTCGYAKEPDAERAYDWLIANRLPDGAWPTGISAGNYGYVAGYRRLAHSRWGCRSNTTACLICLAHHPQRRMGTEAQRALDLLLGRETREQHALGIEVTRLIGAEKSRGFLTYFARFDLALLLDLCWRVGASIEDDRVADLVEFIKTIKGSFGLWEYPARLMSSRWVTFDILRSLSRIDRTQDWFSFEPRTPFQAYPRWRKRY